MSKDMLKGPGYTEVTFYEIESHGVREALSYYFELRCKEIEDARRGVSELKRVYPSGAFRIIKVTRRVTERRKVVQ